MFIDSAKINVKAGDGGNGCNSFFHDNRVVHGKPNGGHGGNGGNVILKAEPSVYTLLDFQYKRHFNAQNGNHGSSNYKAGARGADYVIKVPVGTMVTDVASGCLIRDLNESYLEVIVAKAGLGGRGNSRGREAQRGETGETRELALNLKLIADVGIVGFPNAGKSTLISKISGAAPKIANYPFTTKSPTLGVVRLEDKQFVVADIPGLIKGAHQGKGLGDKFLKHVERTKILIHLIDMAGVDGRDPGEDYRVINEELSAYSSELKGKKQILAANKMDLESASDNLKRFKKKFKKKIIVISCLNREGLDVLLEEIEKYLPESCG